MEQLTFELAAPEPPSFANFVAGPQRRSRRGARARSPRATLRETGVLSVGRRRRRQDAPAARGGRGRARRARRALLRATPGATCRRSPPVRRARWSRSTTSTGPTPTAQGAAVHAVQRAAGTRGPAAWPRRARRRRACRCATTCARGWAGAWSTRSLPLSDADKPAALARYARGARLPPGRRRHRLPARARPPRHGDAGRDAGRARPPFAGDASGRSRSPLLREWLQRDLPLATPAADAGRSAGDRPSRCCRNAGCRRARLRRRNFASSLIVQVKCRRPRHAAMRCCQPAATRVR